MNTTNTKTLNGLGDNGIAGSHSNAATPVKTRNCKPSKSVMVAPDEVLRCILQNRDMGIYFMSKGLSRYDLVYWVDHQICEHLWKKRKIYWPDGREFVYRPGALDDALRNDSSLRLIDEWFERIEAGGPWQRTSEPSLAWHRLFRISATIVSPKQVMKWGTEE